MLGCMSFAAAERARLATLLLELGPDAPTLCEGWATRDLAVHLLLRESDLLAATGMFLPVGQGWLDKATEQQFGRDYEDVVRQWAAGPPARSPFRLIDVPANTVEHFIHHEDARRGGGEVTPREFSAVVNRQLHKALQGFAPRILGKSTVPVILVPDGLPRVVAADRRGLADQGSAVARVTGPVGELLLWTSGRDAVSLQIEGDPATIQRSSL